MIVDINNLTHQNSVIIRSHFQQANKVYAELESARMYYPDFKHWYYKKVVPEIVFNHRKIITEYRDGELAGVAILKLVGEKKLSTLKVTERYQNKGIGLKLFEKSFEILKTDKPFLTVSEEKLVEFKKVFKYYDFQLTSIHEGLYRDGKKEYFFNEI